MAAASGMRSRMESLDLLANNMANASAPGFKADREFYNLYVSADAESPSGSNLMTEPVMQKQWTDFSQGSLSTTDNPLDLAIGGKGFFAVNSPGGTLFTRDGGFKLSPEGNIQTSQGYALRGQDGKAIHVDPTKSIEIGSDGMVRQDGLDIAHIDLVDFTDVHALSKHGQNYFQLSATDIKPTAAAQAELQQGKLEAANYQPAESAVRLVTVLRQFEMLQKAMTVGSDMNKKVIEDVARV